MSRRDSHSSDLRGLFRLAVHAIVGITDMIERANLTILENTTRHVQPVHRPVSELTTMMYRQIRVAARMAGSGIDNMLNWLTPLLLDNQGWKGREPVIAFVNGVLGDYLNATDNPLSIEMEFRYRGHTIPMNREEILALMPKLNGHILVLVHGLCMSDLQWSRNRHDHGAALERDCGLTPVYLRYNSGLHISVNGRQFARQLEALTMNWPVPVQEISILGHSMGGMVVRSACHYGTHAGYKWPSKLSKLVFLGTPHHGAPLERGGNWFHLLISNSLFLAPFSNLGRIRSSGITDLRYGNLLDQDWEGIDRFAHTGDQRVPVPLPAQVKCYTLAATLGKRPIDVSDHLLGDGLVPINSALGEHEKSNQRLNFRPENQVILRGMNHLDLLSRNEVYGQLKKWLADPARLT